MSEHTDIQWCDATFSPWRGVSAAPEKPLLWNVKFACGKCSVCGRPAPRTGGQCECGVVGMYDRFKIFPSICDWLDDEVPIEWLVDFLRLIHHTPNLDWLLLTKRPENFHKRVSIAEKHQIMEVDKVWVKGEAPPNVWIGVSCENQEMADLRIPQLLKIPARVHFVSAEPLLGPIDFRYPAFNGADSLCSIEGIDWVIFGGESGPNARPCNVEWIRDGVKQCKAAGLAAFVKQLGSHPIHSKFAIDLRHKKGGDPAEWPHDLRVREFPKL